MMVSKMVSLWPFRRRSRLPIRVLSRREADEALEAKVRVMLDMDLDEFRLRVREGRLPDTPAVDHLKFLTGVKEG